MILVVLVNGILSSSTFLLQKKKDTSTKLTMYRILYEELDTYRTQGGTLRKKVSYLDQTFYIAYIEESKQIKEVSISNGEEIVRVQESEI